MLAGRFSGETIFTSWRTTVSPGSVSSQLPPASPARSTITDPGFMPFDGLGGHEPRRRAAGHERGRDDHVEALDRVGQRLLLARALLLGQLARVAALAAGLEAEVEPLRAERLRPARRPRGARRSRSCARRGAWRSRAPAARRRRRRARAPWPAGSCRRRSSASGRSGPSPRRRAAPPGSRRRCSARTARPSPARARCAGSPPSRTPSPWRRRARAWSAGWSAAPGSRSGSSPDPSPRIACGSGGAIVTTTSQRQTSAASRGDLSRPPSANAASVSSASAPAPLCTTTSRPLAFSLLTTSGTSATRCSPAAVSFGTPIRI